ncbi:MAG: hypothetical protein ACOH1Y_18045, partial [Propionicimonas sp.]
GDPSVATLSVDLSNTPRAQRMALQSKLPDSAEIFLVGKVLGATDQQVGVYVNTCAQYVRAYAPPDAHCVDGPIRIGPDGDPSTIPAGSKVTIDQVGGPAVTITAPKTTIGSPGGGTTLVFPPGTAPWAITSPLAGVTLTVPTDQAVSRQAILQAAAPDAIVAKQTKDPESLARYVEQSALLRSALSLAYLLCLLTFMFSMIESRWANERSLVAQRALGIPTAVTRRATAFQFSLAVALGSVLVVPAIAASGTAFLAFWGAHNAQDLSLWIPTTLLAFGGLVLTAATGWLLGRGTLRLDILEDQ